MGAAEEGSARPSPAGDHIPSTRAVAPRRPAPRRRDGRAVDRRNPRCLVTVPPLRCPTGGISR